MEQFDDLDRKPRTKLIVFLFSLLCGICLALFATIGGPIRFVFSLLALVIVLRTFGRLERLANRIWFFVLAIAWYLLLTVVITMAIYLQQNPMPSTG